MKVQSKISRTNSSSIFPPTGMQLRAALLSSCLLLLAAFTPELLLAQTPASKPPNTQDGRGLGLPNSPAKTPPAAAAAAQTQTGETRPELVLQTGYSAFNYVTTLHFSPDARLLATSAFNSNQVKLWEVATGRELRTLAISGGVGGIGQISLSGVSTVAFSHDNRLLAAGGRDNSITIWDLLTGRELQAFKSGSAESIIASLGVLALVFNADGRQLVSLGDAFRTWDVATGQQVRETKFDSLSTIGSLGFGNNKLAVSADGSQLALLANSSPSNPKRVVKIYELASGREARTVKVSDDIETANEVVFSLTPDGRLLAAALDYGRGMRDSNNSAKLKLWDLTAKGDARVLATLDGTGNSNSGLSFSADGRLLAVGAGQSIKVWDTATGSERQTIKLPATSASFGLRDSLAGLAFSRDGKFMATSVLNAPLNIWETETGRAVQTLAGRSNYAYNVTFNADGTRLVSGSKTIWELDAGRGLRASSAGEMFGTLTRDGRLLASTTLSDNKVTLYDTGKPQPLFTLAPAEKAIVAQPPVFSPDGRLVATTYRLSEEDREAAMKAAAPKATKESAKEMQGISKEMIKEMMKNPQAAMKVYSDAIAQQNAQQQSAGQSSIEGQVKLWDTATGRAAATITVPSSNPYLPSSIKAISFNGDGRSVAVLANNASSVSLFDAATGASIRTFGATPGPAATNPYGIPMNMPIGFGGSGSTISTMAFSADGRLLATGGKDSKSDFDMSAMMAEAMRDPKAAARANKATSTEEMMKRMQTSSSGSLKLWDTATGREVRAFAGNTTEIQAVAFSADGKVLASAAADNLIKLWDVATGRDLRTLKGHTAQVNSLSFNHDGGLLASAGNDGSTLLWDARTGAQLATLVSLFDGGEWLVVTPDGLFDGSPAAWNQILWRYDRDTFNVAPIEWFFTEFFYPGLLSDLVAGKRPKPAEDFAQKDRRQPLVKIMLADAAAGGSNPASAVAERNLKLKIEVRETAADAAHPKGSGARDLRLFRNGALVKAWRGDVLGGQTTTTVDVTIPIVAGPNRLTAYAFNQDNVKSKDNNLLITGADNLKRAGNVYILAVGVNTYANAQYNLKYAVADAQTFGAEVKRQQGQLGRYERIEVVSLHDAQATKANILAALSKLAAQTEPEDELVIYFAGHGTAQANKFYLIPHDLGYAGSRTKLTEAGLRSMLAHSISDGELEAAFEGVNASQIMLVIDACNSGQALEAEEKRRGPMNSKGLAQLAYEKGMYILTAAQSFQAALEASEVGHGLLTFALVEEGLKLSAADAQPRNGEIVVREWFDYATARVPAIQTEKLKEARSAGRTLSFVEEEDRGLNLTVRLPTQRPRVFYRRELEAQPLVIARSPPKQ